jgi:hypothetical protein
MTRARDAADCQQYRQLPEIEGLIGVHQLTAVIGAGDLAVGRGGPELAVSCANSFGALRASMANC